MCGGPLLRKGSRGPLPQRWCSDACRREANRLRLAARRNREAFEARERFEALRELLMELAPDGLTDECPARRAVAA